MGARLQIKTYLEDIDCMLWYMTIAISWLSQFLAKMQRPSKGWDCHICIHAWMHACMHCMLHAMQEHGFCSPLHAKELKQGSSRSQKAINMD